MSHFFNTAWIWLEKDNKRSDSTGSLKALRLYFKPFFFKDFRETLTFYFTLIVERLQLPVLTVSYCSPSSKNGALTICSSFIHYVPCRRALVTMCFFIVCGLTSFLINFNAFFTVIWSTRWEMYIFFNRSSSLSFFFLRVFQWLPGSFNFFPTMTWCRIFFYCLYFQFGLVFRCSDTFWGDFICFSRYQETSVVLVVIAVVLAETRVVVGKIFIALGEINVVYWETIVRLGKAWIE